MARPKKQVGDLGKPHFTRRGTAWLARTEIRLAGGDLREISASGPDKEAAHAALQKKANDIWGFVPIKPETTIATLATAWLDELRASALAGELGAVREQTVEQYDRTVRRHILPMIGGMPTGQITVAYATSMLRTISREYSPGAANRVRHLCSAMYDLAIQHGAIDQQVNPFRGTKRAATPESDFIELDAAQVILILQLLAAYRGGSPDRRGGISADTALVIDLILIILGSSERTSEPLALRYDDVRFAASTDDSGATVVTTSVLVDGTIVWTKSKGLHRQASPKNKRQTRWIVLPSYAADVIKRRIADYVENPELNPDRLLFVTRTGRPRDPRNLNRILRGFRLQHRSELEEAGIDVDLLTFRAFRKAVATVLTDNASIEAAAAVLGHASSNTTRRHYAKPRIPVVSGASELEAAFGRIVDGLER